MATNAPDIYSNSTDRWQSVEYRTFTRLELPNNSMTTVTDVVFEGGERHAYAACDYFGNGKFNSRQSWSLYKIADYIEPASALGQHHGHSRRTDHRGGRLTSNRP